MMSTKSPESNELFCVVFDTNVLLSAVLLGAQAEYALNLVVDNRIRGVISESILHEAEQKLIKKFQRSNKEVEQQLRTFRKLFTLVEPIDVVIPKLRDPRDIHIIGTAIAAKADLILTTDRDLLTLKRHGMIGIVHPKTLRWTLP